MACAPSWNPPTDARKADAILWLRECKRIVIDPKRIPFDMRDFDCKAYQYCPLRDTGGSV